jgi:hypothetical protein
VELGLVHFPVTKPGDHGGGGEDIDRKHLCTNEAVQKRAFPCLELPQYRDVNDSLVLGDFRAGTKLRLKGANLEGITDVGDISKRSSGDGR